ncbi:MAG: CotH kinase family protein, partial [Lachnospiraceae bacterium]|nr:CotH kinase family protein [Lachnospiraceae bacterium]
SDVSLIYTDDDYDSYENIFTNAKTDLTDADKTRLISALKDLNAGDNLEDTVDIDAVIRYFVVHNFVCNFDSYTGSMIHNYYLYEEDGRLSMIPWDYNLAFGGFEGSMDANTIVNYPVDTPVSGGDTDSRPMLAWIFADENYTSLYHQYFSEFIASFFESGLFEETIDETYALIAPYVEKDPTKFCTYEEFETGVDTLKNLCLLRAESVRGQLEGRIPSDSEGQAADATALIDASDLKISDMGTMDQNHGGNRGKNQGGSREGNQDNKAKGFP